MRKMMKVTAVATILFTAQAQAMETESVNADTLASEISACTLNLEQNTSEQETPVDDPIYFTIRNETSVDVPVTLRITYLQPPHISYLFQEFKSVKAHTESTFRQSECIRFKEEIDAYTPQEPYDFNFLVAMSFNMENMGFKRKNINPDALSGAIDCSIHPSYVPYGRTYIIKPNNYISHCGIMVKSFKIKEVD